MTSSIPVYQKYIFYGLLSTDWKDLHKSFRYYDNTPHKIAKYLPKFSAEKSFWMACNAFHNIFRCRETRFVTRPQQIPKSKIAINIKVKIVIK